MAPRRAVLVALAALMGACAPISRDYAPAYEPPGHSVAASPVSFSVDSVGGAPVTTYALGDALFVEGREGDGYTLRLTNHTPNRYEAVVTIDGRDVVSGETGRPRKQRGYVLEPYETLVIDGYRRSLDEVASFYFASMHDSYAARRGSAKDTGVIAVALFEEKTSRSKPQPLTRRSSPASPGAGSPSPSSAYPMESETEDRAGADMSMAAESAEPEAHLGTGYGAAEYSPVHETSFKRRRKGRPDVRMTVYYDSHDGLVARGVLPRRVEHSAPHEPAYDPGYDPGYAAPPWQRDR